MERIEKWEQQTDHRPRAPVEGGKWNVAPSSRRVKDRRLRRACNITMTSILFLITVSELPRRMGYQYNMLIRATRYQWLCSQILYCLWMTLLMLLLVVLCAAIFILPGVAPGNGWTDDIRIMQGLFRRMRRWFRCSSVHISRLLRLVSMR